MCTGMEIPAALAALAPEALGAGTAAGAAGAGAWGGPALADIAGGGLGGLLGGAGVKNAALLAGNGLLTQRPQQAPPMAQKPPSMPVQSSQQIMGDTYQPQQQSGVPQGLNDGAMGMGGMDMQRLLAMLRGGQ